MLCGRIHRRTFGTVRLMLQPTLDDLLAATTETPLVADCVPVP